MKHQNIVDKAQRLPNDRAVTKAKKSLSTFNQSKTFPETKSEFPQLDTASGSGTENDRLLGKDVLGEIKSIGGRKAKGLVQEAQEAISKRFGEMDGKKIAKTSLLIAAGGIAVAAAVVFGKKYRDSESGKKLGKSISRQFAAVTKSLHVPKKTVKSVKTAARKLERKAKSGLKSVPSVAGSKRASSRASV